MSSTMLAADLIPPGSTAPLQEPGLALAARAVNYSTAAGKSLLSDVSAALEPGRLLAVIGPNGAGKTTLLRLFANELSPESGEVLLDSCPLDRWPAHERARRIAILPQQSTLSAALTGLEVVLVGRSPHPTRGSGPEDLALAHEALALMDAAHLAARHYPSLSGGEKSRVQAARVLAQILEPSSIERMTRAFIPPRFLLLDEPTAALDCAHQHQLLTRVRHISRAQNIGVLAILHDLNLAAQYGDELLVLKDGRSVACGPTKTIFEADMLSAVFGLRLLVIAHPRHDRPMAIPE